MTQAKTKTTTAKTEAPKTEAPKVDTKQFEDAVTVSKQNVEKAVAATKEQVEKASTAALKGYDDFAGIQKESMDAFVKASNTLAKGYEEMGKAAFAFAQTSTEANVEAAKSLMAAKTINDVVEIQSDLARNQFDKFVAEGTKLSEMGLKVTNDAFEPLQAQMNVVIERSMKPAQF